MYEVLISCANNAVMPHRVGPAGGAHQDLLYKQCLAVDFHVGK
jgi:hypothetical protein